MTIFVSVASYRDILLAPTVRDCLDKADRPEDLVFGICWQHGDDETLPEWMAGDRYRILDVDYRESRGACWARAEIKGLYAGEDWFLQLDSHHLFADGWDTLVLDDAARSGSERPVITTYGTPFDWAAPDELDQRPMSMLLRGFSDHGLPTFMPAPVTGEAHRRRPRRARFLSGHFHLAPGSFVADVPHDPELYFGGEENTLAARAFTHGYDLFEPSRLVVWHEYSRSYRRKHWDDHDGTGGVAWHERDAVSYARARRLFEHPHTGTFGLGTARTLADYEAYAGVDYAARTATDATLRNDEPPPPGRRGPDPAPTATRTVESQSGTIFVSIAAYREPELVPTVRDCLDKARHPQRLRFGICWQHAPDEALPDWMSGEQFRILDVDAADSGGANWARAQVQGLWQGEEWYLQLDSHHRFAQDWDAFLVEEIARTGSDRPVLTTYGPPYQPGEELVGEPMSMVFRTFTEDGLPLFIPAAVPGWRERTAPRPARFASAHLLFAPSSFIRDVPVDPDLYFNGDEGILAVRAFTHGYDLFEPTRVVAWHLYLREDQPKHWDDHAAWWELDGTSRAKMRRIFADGEPGRHGLGTVRSLADYEAYAGISFRYHVVQDHTRRNLDAPNPPSEPDWPWDLVRPARVPGLAWESSGDRHVASIPGPQPRRCELNSTGALLVELADGRHSAREIADYLRRTQDVETDQALDILDFYRDAGAAGLVTLENRHG